MVAPCMKFPDLIVSFAVTIVTPHKLLLVPNDGHERLPILIDRSHYLFSSTAGRGGRPAVRRIA